MRTSRSVLSLGELQNLISNYEICSVENDERLADEHKYFIHLLYKYLPKPSRHRRDFMERTNLGKDIYSELRGYKIGGRKKDISLLRVAFGLGITYEEALILFLYNGRTLVYDETSRKINRILLKLDDFENKSDSEKRMATLDFLIYDYNLKL